MPVRVKKHVRRNVGVSRFTPPTDIRRASLTELLRVVPGPGKYEGEFIFAPYIHELTLEGFGGDATGDVTDFGFYAQQLNLRGDLRHLYQVAADAGTPLTAAEKRFLFENPFVIVGEDSFGFITIQYFSDKTEWQREFDAVNEQYIKFEEQLGGID